MSLRNALPSANRPDANAVSVDGTSSVPAFRPGRLMARQLRSIPHVQKHRSSAVSERK